MVVLSVRGLLRVPGGGWWWRYTLNHGTRVWVGKEGSDTDEGGVCVGERVLLVNL